VIRSQPHEIRTFVVRRRPGVVLNRDFRRSGPGTDGLFPQAPIGPYVAIPRVAQWARLGGSHPMQKLKSQGFRILMILSALASSALVLEAGQRWR